MAFDTKVPPPTQEKYQFEGGGGGILSLREKKSITLNSGKEVSAPQIIQGREFMARDITSFMYRLIRGREFTIFSLFSVLPHFRFPSLSL